MASTSAANSAFDQALSGSQDNTRNSKYAQDEHNVEKKDGDCAETADNTVQLPPDEIIIISSDSCPSHDDDSDDDYIPPRYYTNITDRVSKKQQFVNTRKTRNSEGKLDQNRISENTENAREKKSEKRGSDTIGDTIGKTNNKGNRKIRKAKYVQELNEDSDSDVTEVASGESSRTVRRSMRLSSRAKDDPEKPETDAENSGCTDVALAVPKISNDVDKFLMKDISLDDLEKLFRNHISYIKEINIGTRPSKRNDEFKNGSLRAQTLIYEPCLNPYSMEQYLHLSYLCRTEFCHSIQERIACFSYIKKVLVPDLCNKFFMDRFQMNQAEAEVIYGKMLFSK